MYDGWDDIEDEVRQNARDQQHPATFQEVVRSFRLAPTQEIPALSPVPRSIPGLSRRQMDLIDNKDGGQPNTGAARERRLEIIQRDIAAIKRFLPRMDEVRGFVSTMPHDNDEELIEAMDMADMQLTKFITTVAAKLASLETELELKKVPV